MDELVEMEECHLERANHSAMDLACSPLDDNSPVYANKVQTPCHQSSVENLVVAIDQLCTAAEASACGLCELAKENDAKAMLQQAHPDEMAPC
jgi:hypothetical protein